MADIRATTAKAARPRRRLLTAPRLLAGAICGAGGFIVVNAVALQTERHPAPMFQPVARANERVPLPPQRAEAASARVPAFDTRPIASAKPAADRQATLERAALAEKLARDETAGERPRPAGAAPTKEAPGLKTQAMRDALIDLVRRSEGDEKPQKTVLDVQRALNKAGYGPLSEDGQIGPSTRAALVRFEQDRKLPPKGELKGPVLRALASASGIAIAQ